MAQVQFSSRAWQDASLDEFNELLNSAFRYALSYAFGFDLLDDVEHGVILAKTLSEK